MPMDVPYTLGNGPGSVVFAEVEKIEPGPFNLVFLKKNCLGWHFRIFLQLSKT
jgi:hypothetical protein